MVTNSKKSMTIMPRYSGEGEETALKAKTMKKVNKAKEVIRDYKKALDELVKFKDEALRQIDDNPFIRRKWSLIDKLYAKILSSELPPTQYETMVKETERMFNENLDQLKLNVTKLIDEIYDQT